MAAYLNKKISKSDFELLQAESIDPETKKLDVNKFLLLVRVVVRRPTTTQAHTESIDTPTNLSYYCTVASVRTHTVMCTCTHVGCYVATDAHMGVLLGSCS
jgi:hypothetical protein